MLSKKFLIMSMCLLIAVSMIPSAALAFGEFSDVPAGVWYENQVTRLVSQGIIGGYPDGTFKPNKTVTRAEFAKMICLAMKWSLDEPSEASFKDVPKSNWTYRYAETAKANGAISGYSDGTFKPAKNITRAEMAKIVAETLNLPTAHSTLNDADSVWWAKAYIGACVNSGIISGYPDNTFKPNKEATRAEAAKIINGVLDKR